MQSPFNGSRIAGGEILHVSRFRFFPRFLRRLVEGSCGGVESVDDLIDGDDALVEVVFRRFQRRSTPRILRAVS